MPDARQGGHAHQLVEAGQGDGADERRHLGAEAAGSHQDHPLGALGELVGELHRHAATEAVPDHGHLVDVQHGEQVAHAVGVAAHGVVGTRLGAVAVTQQVGRDDGVVPGQVVDDRQPGGVRAAETVQQQQRRALAHLHEGALMTVDRDPLELDGTAWDLLHTNSSGRCLGCQAAVNQNSFQFRHRHRHVVIMGE